MRPLSTAVGGPLGRRAALRGPGTAVAVLAPLAAAAVWLGFLLKAPCLDVSRWTDSFAYTRLCYTDVVALWGAERLGEGAVPYADHPVEYPVGIGALMHAARLGVEGLAAVGLGPGDAGAFLVVTTVLLSAAAAVVAGTTARLAGPGRAWDAALVAVSPVLVLHGTINWDLAAVALAGLGLLAWARDRPVLAGVLLGLGAVTKLYPLLLLLPLVLVAARRGRLGDAGRAGAGAAGALLAVLGPAWLLAAEFDGTNALLRFVELNRTRPADWDSLWWVVERLRDEPFSSPALTAGVAVALLLALTAVVALGLLAPRPPRVAQLALLTVVAFLATGKVFSPQFALWVLPLAVLARPSWPLLLGWQVTEVAVLVTRYLFFTGLDDPGTGLVAGPFVAAVLLRDLALLVLAAVVVRDVLVPGADPVRAGGLDDPAAGGGTPGGQPGRAAARVPAGVPAAAP